MAEAPRPTKFGEELGKALADRLGLVHQTTAIEYTVDLTATSVLVTMTTVKTMSRDEYEELRAAALQRSKNA